MLVFFDFFLIGKWCNELEYIAKSYFSHLVTPKTKKIIIMGDVPTYDPYWDLFVDYSEIRYMQDGNYEYLRNI